MDSPANTPETEGDTDGLRKTEESETAEEEGLPAFTVTFTKAGIEVVCRNMNSVPLTLIERAQHLSFRQIMVERQQAYRHHIASERKPE